jgi:hypothetical protein
MTVDLVGVLGLLGRYAERMDAGDFDGLGALFGADGCLAAGDGPPFVTGATAIAGFYRGGTRLHGGTVGTTHVVSGPIVGSVGDDGTVPVRSTFVVLQAVEGFPLQPIITGRYRDRVVADPSIEGGWRFVERRFDVDLVGELDQHLARPDIVDGP